MADRIEASQNNPSFEAAAEILNMFLKINFRVQSLLLDYSIAAAILGSIPPAPWIYEITLIGVVFLNLKMMRDIGREWGYPKGQNLLAIFLALFGVIGALAMMLMAYVTVYSIGLLFLPFVRSWAGAAAFFTLTLALGNVTNQFYLRAKRISPESLRRAWRRRRFELSEHPKKL